MGSIKQKCGTCEESFPGDTLVCPQDGSSLRPVIAGTLTGVVLLERYHLMEEIGRGGMGVIYKADDQNAVDARTKVVAIKLLLNNARDNEILTSRFVVEARAASMLNHPNIVKIYQHNFTGEGLPFMVLEWLAGPTLEELIENAQVDFERSVRLVVQICGALNHAHRHGVIHRDVKPSNIIVVDSDGSDKAVIVDFGIAKIFSQPGKTSMHLTQTGQIFGSPMYMSPEQCMGLKLDARSDIYSLGCVLYEMITGSTPFSGESALTIIFKHVNEEPLRFASSRKEKILESIVFKAMAKKIDERFQTMEELSQALQDYLQLGTAPSNDVSAERDEHAQEVGITGDAQQQLYYYQTGAEMGDASAQLELALFYRDGYLVEKNNALAFEWCLKAASQGHVDAMAHLADMYANGDVIELDYDKAYFWFYKAALQDHPYSAHMVAYLIENKFVAEGDDAIKWYKRAALLEDIEAQKYLARLYLEGEKIEPDIDEATRWSTRAANQGDADAQFLLGTIYQDFVHPPDFEKAAHWFLLSAEQGFPEACRFISTCYQQGLGVELNEPEALKWMTEAADHDDPQACYRLGLWHKYGEFGLPPNSKIANKYFLTAANLGDSDAQYFYALQLLVGDDVARNYESAVNWLKKAARASHGPATYQLAKQYERGEGTSESQSEYHRLLKKAAELGAADAQFELGTNFWKDGLPKQARLWLNQAAAQDHESAMQKLLELGEQDSPLEGS